MTPRLRRRAHRKQPPKPRRVILTVELLEERLAPAASLLDDNAWLSPWRIDLLQSILQGAHPPPDLSALGGALPTENPTTGAGLGGGGDTGGGGGGSTGGDAGGGGGQSQFPSFDPSAPGPGPAAPAQATASPAASASASSPTGGSGPTGGGSPPD